MRPGDVLVPLSHLCRGPQSASACLATRSPVVAGKAIPAKWIAASETSCPIWLLSVGCRIKQPDLSVLLLDCQSAAGVISP